MYSQNQLFFFARGPDRTGGGGIGVQDGAALAATGCTVQGNTGMGVFASNAGTTVHLVDTEVLSTRTGAITGFAGSVHAQEDAFLRASGGEISGTAGPGLYVVAGGRTQFDRVRLIGNRFAGAVVLDGSAVLSAVTITDTLADAEWGGGFGASASDLGGPSSLTLTDSTIGPHRHAAIWLDVVGAYDIQGNSLSGSEGILLSSRPAHGNAVFAENEVTAWDRTAGLLLARNTFTDAALIAVLLHHPSASLEGNTWANNTVDVRQQHGSSDGTLLAKDDLADVQLAERE